MSQGGVYKYFNNIDQVFAALIDEANLKGNYFEQINIIMESANPPEIILKELFDISEHYFSDMLISYNKILFELSTFFTYNPERCEKIKKEVTTSSTFDYLIKCAEKIIITEVERKYFVPIMPAKDIIDFIVASFDGIIRDVTITKCYGRKDISKTDIIYDEKNLIRCLYISTMTLLGKTQIEEKR